MYPKPDSRVFNSPHSLFVIKKTTLNLLMTDYYLIVYLILIIKNKDHKHSLNFTSPKTLQPLG